MHILTEMQKILQFCISACIWNLIKMQKCTPQFVGAQCLKMEKPPRHTFYLSNFDVYGVVKGLTSSCQHQQSEWDTSMFKRSVIFSITWCYCHHLAPSWTWRRAKTCCLARYIYLTIHLVSCARQSKMTVNGPGKDILCWRIEVKD